MALCGNDARSALITSLCLASGRSTSVMMRSGVTSRLVAAPTFATCATTAKSGCATMSAQIPSRTNTRLSTSSTLTGSPDWRGNGARSAASPDPTDLTPGEFPGSSSPNRERDPARFFVRRSDRGAVPARVTRREPTTDRGHRLSAARCELNWRLAVGADRMRGVDHGVDDSFARPTRVAKYAIVVIRASTESRGTKRVKGQWAGPPDQVGGRPDRVVTATT